MNAGVPVPGWEEPAAIKRFREMLRDNITKRFFPLTEHHPLALLSALLHPQTHGLITNLEVGFTREELALAKQLLTARVVEQLQKIAQPPVQRQPLVVAPTTALFAKLNARPRQDAPIDRETAAARIVDAWMQMDIVADDIDPKKLRPCPASAYWRVHANQYPEIAAVARQVLAIPATSAASERVFSTAGRICTKLRSGITPKLLEAMVREREHHSKPAEAMISLEPFQHDVVLAEVNIDFESDESDGYE